MQQMYLVLAIVGFSISAYATPSTIEHGNLFFVVNPAETIELLFGNYVSAAFGADLLWVFIVFCVWAVDDSRKRGFKHSWLFVLLALLFGVSGPLPLFLYWRGRETGESRARPNPAIEPTG
jgi:hypothetical protein